MPSLSDEQQRDLLGPRALKCDRCGRNLYQNYCRSCDEFFYVCNCPVEPGSPDDHQGHRTY